MQQLVVILAGSTANLVNVTIHEWSRKVRDFTYKPKEPSSEDAPRGEAPWGERQSIEGAHRASRDAPSTEGRSPEVRGASRDARCAPEMRGRPSCEVLRFVCKIPLL